MHIFQVGFRSSAGLKTAPLPKNHKLIGFFVRDFWRTVRRDFACIACRFGSTEAGSFENREPAVQLRSANEEGLRFIAELRERFSGNAKPIVLNALIGPRGDAYHPEAQIAMAAAEDYFTEQLGWIAATEANRLDLQSSWRSCGISSSCSDRRSARGRFVHRGDPRSLADRPETIRRDQAGRRGY